MNIWKYYDIVINSTIGSYIGTEFLQKMKGEIEKLNILYTFYFFIFFFIKMKI